MKIRRINRQVSRWTNRTARSAKQKIESVIRRNMTNGAVRSMARFSQWYLRSFWNDKVWDMRENGEHHFLNCWKRYLRKTNDTLVVFDAGAHRGDYTKHILAGDLSTRVHCFEIIPAIGETLREEFANHENVTVNMFGLSDTNGTIPVHYFPDSISENRVHSLRKDIDAQMVQCEIRRGDDYVLENCVACIDLLKIDTEGHEVHVLKGFRETLGSGQIQAIQFEYGTTFLASRSLLSDIYELLEPFGFVIGRVFQQGVFFKEFQLLEDEHFRMGNYVAVRREHADLIHRLDINRRRLRSVI